MGPKFPFFSKKIRLIHSSAATDRQIGSSTSKWKQTPKKKGDATTHTHTQRSDLKEDTKNKEKIDEKKKNSGKRPSVARCGFAGSFGRPRAIEPDEKKERNRERERERTRDERISWWRRRRAVDGDWRPDADGSGASSLDSAVGKCCPPPRPRPSHETTTTTTNKRTTPPNRGRSSSPKMAPPPPTFKRVAQRGVH